MATERQIRANRANAQRSTGPRTAAGKLKSSRNAYRHGLSGSVSYDPSSAAKVNLIARALAGETIRDERVAAGLAIGRKIGRGRPRVRMRVRLHGVMNAADGLQGT